MQLTIQFNRATLGLAMLGALLLGTGIWIGRVESPPVARGADSAAAVVAVKPIIAEKPSPTYEWRSRGIQAFTVQPGELSFKPQPIPRPGIANQPVKIRVSASRPVSLAFISVSDAASASMNRNVLADPINYCYREDVVAADAGCTLPGSWPYSLWLLDRRAPAPAAPPPTTVGEQAVGALIQHFVGLDVNGINQPQPIPAELTEPIRVTVEISDRLCVANCE